MSSPPPPYPEKDPIYPPAGSGSSSFATVLAPGPPPPQQPNVIIQQQPPPGTVVYLQPAAMRFDRFPVQMKCPHCHADITTAVMPKIGLLNWAVAGSVCLGGLICPIVWLGCCFIPLCISDLKDCEHYCPNCRTMVGLYRRIS